MCACSAGIAPGRPVPNHPRTHSFDPQDRLRRAVFPHRALQPRFRKCCRSSSIAIPRVVVGFVDYASRQTVRMTTALALRSRLLAAGRDDGKVSRPVL